MTCRKQCAGVWIHINLYYGYEKVAGAGVVKHTGVGDERSKWRTDRAGLRIKRCFRSLFKEDIERLRTAGPEQVAAARVVNSNRVVDGFDHKSIAHRKALVRRLEFAINAVRSGKRQIRLLKLAQSEKSREIAADDGITRRSRNMSGPYARRAVIAVCTRNIEVFVNLKVHPEKTTGE
jgi:hypothetical protein